MVISDWAPELQRTSPAQCYNAESATRSSHGRGSVEYEGPKPEHQGPVVMVNRCGSARSLDGDGSGWDAYCASALTVSMIKARGGAVVTGY
jgi:hypothetical protein